MGNTRCELVWGSIPPWSYAPPRNLVSSRAMPQQHAMQLRQQTNWARKALQSLRSWSHRPYSETHFDHVLVHRRRTWQRKESLWPRFINLTWNLARKSKIQSKTKFGAQCHRAAHVLTLHSLCPLTDNVKRSMAKRWKGTRKPVRR